MCFDMKDANCVDGGRTVQALLLLFLALASSDLIAGDWPVERRKEQFPEASGRLLAPVPYSMPGLGEGFFILGHFTNAFSSTSDITIIQATGDIKGSVLSLSEVPLVNKRLFARAELIHLSSVQQNYYQNRGMNTEKDDYKLLDVGSY